MPRIKPALINLDLPSSVLHCLDKPNDCYFAEVPAPSPNNVTRGLLPLGPCMACRKDQSDCLFRSEGPGSGSEQWSCRATVFLHISYVTLRQRYLAGFHRDCQQAEIVLRQLQSCTIRELDHIGSELVKDMIADNVCVFSLGE
jgi:hypothetical protein